MKVIIAIFKGSISILLMVSCIRIIIDIFGIDPNIPNQAINSFLLATVLYGIYYLNKTTKESNK